MITALELRNAEFSRSARGYKATEVDEVLEEAASSIEQLQKENSELLRKMDVLAQKIHEYRQDEDSIKSALVMAQRTADSVMRDAKEKAESENYEINKRAKETLESAIAKAEKLTREAEEKAMIIARETKNKSVSIIAEAKDKAGKMIFEIMDMRRKEQSNYEKLKKQASNFRVELLNLYKTQVELINRLPEDADDASQERVPEVPDVDISEISKKVEEIIPQIETLPDYTSDAEGESIFDEKDDIISHSPESEKIDITEFSSPEEIQQAPVEAETTNEVNSGGKISGGFVISEEEQSFPKKFGNIKFGDYYDPNDDEDDDNEVNEKHSFFRKKK